MPRVCICFSKMENIVTYDEETIRLLLSFLFNDLEENDVDEWSCGQALEDGDGQGLQGSRISHRLWDQDADGGTDGGNPREGGDENDVGNILHSWNSNTVVHWYILQGRNLSTVKARFSRKSVTELLSAKNEIFRYFERTYVLKIKNGCANFLKGVL